MQLPPHFHLLTPEQQEACLVALLQKKQKERDWIMRMLARLRGSQSVIPHPLRQSKGFGVDVSR